MKIPCRLEISLDHQRLDLIKNESIETTYPVSSAAKGMGSKEGSLRTPVGRFKINGKIGRNAPIHTRFDARVPVGTWDPSHHTGDDLILTRIMRLDGIDPENANTLSRYIYIHGTNREDLIGTPASHGCIRLANHDMVDLFARCPDGADVIIHPATRPGPKLLFVDCDSTLSAIEGIDELARLANPAAFAEVERLTNDAMDGKIPLGQVFGKRMEIIRPGQQAARHVSRLYIENIVLGVPRFIAMARADGWLPVILSGGFAPLIAPLAEHLGITHLEAVPLFFDSNGLYDDYGRDFPTTRNMGKNEIIREWRAALLPARTVMIGDGISDLETKPDVDLMIGFGGVINRSMVRTGAHVWLASFSSPRDLIASMNS